MQLQEIYQPIASDLDKVERALNSFLPSEEKFIRQMEKRLFSSPGKMIRPALVLFAARVGGRTKRSDAIDLASAVELIHTATLVQDDVIDRAALRRGAATISKKWGNSLAILLGDYLYAKAFRFLTKLENSRVLAALAQTASLMCVGEMEQLKRAKTFLSEQVYLKIIERKTASLFSTCCETGAVVGGASPAQVEALKNFGAHFGLAFQIVDDCLDCSSSAERTKKSVGLDEKMGKVTLPIIYQSVEKAAKKAQYQLAAASKSIAIIPLARKQPFIELGDYLLGRLN